VASDFSGIINGIAFYHKALMSEWRAYERKRAALERKWKPKVFKALQSQLNNYLSDPDKNLDKHFNFGAIVGLLQAIYRDAGVKMANDTKRELRGLKKAHNVVLRTKFRGFGFNEDFAQGIAERLRMTGLNLAQKMSETTRKKIQTILAYASENGLSVDETVRLIKSQVTEINRSRAVTIVRTEVGRSANEGKLLGAMAMGIMMDKIWLTAEDERVRRRPRDKGDHLVMHDKRVELDKFFTNGMYVPGDHNAPAHEVVNCRCTLVFKAVRDSSGNTIPKNYFEPARNPIGEFTQGLVAGIGLGLLTTTD
jgi:hypothetical protein